MAELLVLLDAIRQNTAVVAGLLRRNGLDLVAVTKGCLGDPRVAGAMVEGGALALADTHDDHLRRLRLALPAVELHRIHLPPSCGPFEPGDLTYVSGREGAEAVARLGGVGPRRVMIWVETGDLREGVPFRDVEDIARLIAEDPRLELAGLATNYACFLGSPEGIRGSVGAVAALGSRLRRTGVAVARVSGGNSSLINLLVRGERLPAEVTELRCGEALLLGQDALMYEPVPGCRQDACVLSAEVLEDHLKDTPDGMKRLLVIGIGRQDVASGSVRFLQAGLREVGRSSDYLVAEAEPREPRVTVGDSVEMIPGYTALVAAWASEYVRVGVS